jgi:hypothetical protein
LEVFLAQGFGEKAEKAFIESRMLPCSHSWVSLDSPAQGLCAGRRVHQVASILLALFALEAGVGHKKTPEIKKSRQM